jgi:hypothetical protein
MKNAYHENFTIQDVHSGPVRNRVGGDAGVVADIKLSDFFNLVGKD